MARPFSTAGFLEARDGAAEAMSQVEDEGEARPEGVLQAEDDSELLNFSVVTLDGGKTMSFVGKASATFQSLLRQVADELHVGAFQLSLCRGSTVFQVDCAEQTLAELGFRSGGPVVELTAVVQVSEQLLDPRRMRMVGIPDLDMAREHQQLVEKMTSGYLFDYRFRRGTVQFALEAARSWTAQDTISVLLHDEAAHNHLACRGDNPMEIVTRRRRMVDFARQAAAARERQLERLVVDGPGVCNGAEELKVASPDAHWNVPLIRVNVDDSSRHNYESMPKQSTADHSWASVRFETRPPAQGSQRSRALYMPRGWASVFVPALCLSLCLLNVNALSTACTGSGELFSWIRSKGGGSSVQVGFAADGLRGLVVDRACAPGDVLLEIPLALAISDSSGDAPPLEGAAPEWAWGLPWNVQLAVAVLERQSALGGAADPFLESWPAVSPPLPIACTAAEFDLASDPSLATKADEVVFWLDEQYWRAREAIAAKKGVEPEEADFASASAFRDAMALVWSRCLRVTTAEHGVRHVLVPLLDLANHEACPSAMYAFASGASSGGPAIRLHAARSLEKGDAVTITYGEHSSTHFALYYGFVPRANPSDSIGVTLEDVLSSQPAELLPSELRGGEEPPEGWAAQVRALVQAHCAAATAAEEDDDLCARQFGLYERAPSGALLRALRALLPGGDADAARAIAYTVAAIERALWGFNVTALDAHDEAAATAAAADERTLAIAEGSAEAEGPSAGTIVPAEGEDPGEEPVGGESPLSDRGRVLLRLRLSRRLLLANLRRTMVAAADLCDADPEAGAASLDALAEAADTAPPVYPALDALPVEELGSWEAREWAWDDLRWAD